MRTKRPLPTAALLLLLAWACAPAGPRPAAPDPEAPPLTVAPTTAAQEAEAAELFERARSAFSAGDHAASRAAAQEVIRRFPATRVSSAALFLAADAAYRLGDYAAAAELAERYVALFPDGSPRASRALVLAQRSRDRMAAAEPAAIVIGVLLPQSGSPILKEYADLVLEGIRIAADAFTATGPGRVELVVLDDAGDAARTRQLVQDLERRGAVGVIGPLRDAGLREAARSRGDTTLAMISPTATEPVSGSANVYSLNATDTWGAEALARYAVESGGARAAVLYPRTPAFERQARAFTAALHAAGGDAVADVPYLAGTTTFEAQLERVRASGARAVFVPAPERDVRQIASQLAFYGVTRAGVRVLGGEAWALPEIRRLVDARYLEGVVVSTPLIETSADVAWSEFVELYERTYRRSLDNPFPALGFDAANLLLAAHQGGLGGRAEVARRLSLLDDLRGATGRLSVQGGAVLRRPFLARIQGGELVPIGADAGTAAGRGGER